MNLIYQSLFLIALATSTLACGHANAQNAQRQIENIQVSSAVPDDQVTRLQADLNYLKTLTFTNPDPDLLTLMGLTSITPDTLLAWLQERVHYVIDENLDLDTAITVASSSYSYPNPGILPVLEDAPKTPTDGSSPSGTPAPAKGQVITVMLNLGGGIYLAGKENNLLLNLAIPGVGTVTITSPRAGILKVGQGLFARLFQDASLTPDSKPYIALRLSTLFHEAHHSDGNGTSLGFIHAICPSGVYAGYSACDRNLNGPYQLESRFVVSLINACTDCTDGDLAAMRLLAADSASRQITFTPSTAVSTDVAAQITALQTLIDTCTTLRQLSVTIPASLNCDLPTLQTELTGLQSGNATSSPGTPSLVWDSTPEGSYHF